MQVLVYESGKGKFAQEISAGDHLLEADEPISAGGNNLGPSPYEFLLAALGTCTSMTIRLYADLKKISLKKVSVKLTHEKIYLADCENCEDSHSRIDHIDRRIILEGELTEADRNKLLDIANKCPVHRTLTSHINITTEIINN